MAGPQDEGFPQSIEEMRGRNGTAARYPSDHFLRILFRN